MSVETPNSEFRPVANGVTVAYVAGYGRSGSTILDLLLGHRFAAVSAAEISTLFSDATKDPTTKCLCGRTLLECPTWGIAGMDLEGIAEVSKNFESLFANPLARRSAKNQAIYRNAWNSVFQTAAAESGSSLIVDSSKTAYLTAKRLHSLHKYTDVNVVCIHLIRDPRAVTWSMIRGDNKLMDQGLPATMQLPTVRAAVGWVVANVVTELTIKRTGMKSLRLKYEDFVQDPDQAQRDIAELLGEPGQPLAILDGDPANDCGLNGNRVRKKGLGVIKADSEWETKMPRRKRLAALVGAPLLARYGYGIRSSAAKAEIQGS